MAKSEQSNPNPLEANAPSSVDNQGASALADPSLDNDIDSKVNSLLSEPSANEDPLNPPSTGADTGEKLAVTLASIASQGRDALMEELRRHEARTKAALEARVPPPLTDRQKEKIAAQQEAGRRALEKHAERQRLQRGFGVPQASDAKADKVQVDAGKVPGFAQGYNGARDI